MANQDWVLINIKQYCFHSSKKNDIEFFEQMLLGMLDAMTKIKVTGGIIYYDWYLCKKAYEHSKIIRKGERWPEAEKYIKKCPEIAYLYAKFVVKDKWPEAERYIKTDSSAARKYAKYVLKRRWKSAEKTIIDFGKTYRSYGTNDGFDYVINVVKKPNRELENSILNWFAEKNDPNHEYTRRIIIKDSIRYLSKVKKSRWEELELEIAYSSHISDYWKIIKKNKEARDVFYNKVSIAAMMPKKELEFNYAEAWLKAKDVAA